jgi:Na+/H+ antiporter NhaA
VLRTILNNGIMLRQSTDIVFCIAYLSLSRGRYALPKMGRVFLWASVIYFDCIIKLTIIEIFKARSLADG